MEMDHRHALLRFVLPVTAENVGTMLIGIVFSALIGGISSSSLSAISTANLVITLYTALLSLVSIGSAVLTAQLVGARQAKEASVAIEQSILLTLGMGAVLTVFSLACASPVMRLLMPTAERSLLDEAVSYFRVCSLSLIPLMLYTVLSGVLRASGNSRAPFVITTAQNLFQILFAFLFIRLFRWEVLGAGAAMVLCRLIGGAMSLLITLKSRSFFHVRLRACLVPHLPTVRRIVRIGIPAALEALFVQIGYLLANSLVVGLGTQQATIYNVANSLQSFANITNSIGSAIAATFVGQYLGAKRYPEAKRFGYRLVLVTFPTILVLYLIMALLSPYLAPLYTSDAAVVSGAVTSLWVLIGFAIPAQSINVIDPALRSGGDGKFVMIETMAGVWLVRLPLSWLLAYHFEMGVTGIYVANILACLVRMICGQIRYFTGKWMYKRV